MFAENNWFCKTFCGQNPRYMTWCMRDRTQNSIYYVHQCDMLCESVRCISCMYGLYFLGSVKYEEHEISRDLGTQLIQEGQSDPPPPPPPPVAYPRPQCLIAVVVKTRNVFGLH